MPELLARSEAALRRYFKTAMENPVVIAGPLSVNLVTREVLPNQKPVQLTHKSIACCVFWRCMWGSS
jgi:two-component system KDP operon response regulator KdpE